MNNWRSIALVFSLTVNLAVVGTLVYYWGRHDGRRFSPELVPADWLRPFDRDERLNPDIRREIIQLRTGYQKQLRLASSQLLQHRKSLLSSIEKQPADMQEIETQIEQLLLEQRKIEHITVDHLLALKPLLSENQWRSFLRALESGGREFRPRAPKRP